MGDSKLFIVVRPAGTRGEADCTFECPADGPVQVIAVGTTDTFDGNTRILIEYELDSRPVEERKAAYQSPEAPVTPRITHSPG